MIEDVLRVLPGVIEHERNLALGLAVDESQRQQLAARLKTFYRDNFGGYEEFRTTVKTDAESISPAT